MTQFRALVAGLLLSFLSNAQTAAPPAVHDWVRGSAIRLASPVAGHGFDDMQPLKKVVGDARIVSLGEATHGSREFFQLKHRMVEFLTTQMGFTIFSIEANMPEAYKLNDFILNGTGDPAKLIKGTYFWTWDTQEVLDMVLWMREFNKSGKGRIEFTGFDMQTPTVAVDIVREWVAKNDPDYASTLVRPVGMARARTAQQPAFGTAIGSLPVDVARGKTIRFSGYIKTANVSNYAGFWWRSDGRDNKRLTFANLKEAAPKGTTEWYRYELELPVPEDAAAIYFGALLAGSGNAWFDDLQVEIDGKLYQTEAFDFTFEGPALKGLNTAVSGYPTRIDNEVAHGGRQSLRISHAASAPDSDVVDPRLAAAEWRKVVNLCPNLMPGPFRTRAWSCSACRCMATRSPATPAWQPT